MLCFGLWHFPTLRVKTQANAQMPSKQHMHAYSIRVIWVSWCLGERSKKPWAPQLHVPNPSWSFLPPSGFLRDHNTSRLAPLLTNKKTANLLMSQHYMKSLKVDRHARQIITPHAACQASWHHTDIPRIYPNVFLREIPLWETCIIYLSHLFMAR